MKLFVNRVVDKEVETIELDVVEVFRDSDETVTIYCSDDYYLVLEQKTIDKMSK